MGEETTTTLTFPFSFGQNVQVRGVGVSGVIQGLLQCADGRQDALLRYSTDQGQIMESWVSVTDIYSNDDRFGG